MNKKIMSLLGSLVVLTTVSCSTTSIEKKEVKKNSYIQLMTEKFSENNRNTGVVVSIEKDGKTSVYKSGYANYETKKLVNENDYFEIGSASKLFTAIAIMQLVEDKKLSLDTKISKFYPSGDIVKLATYKGKNYWDTITVEMLLNHTTGFIDYLNVHGSSDKVLELYNHSNEVFSFDDLIKLSTDYGDAQFKPGDSFAYCNTNYVILGDIISKVSGMNWKKYIKTNLFEKAGLKDTYLGSELPKEIKDKVITGYYDDLETKMPFSLASSAGEIVSTQKDLQKFLSFFISGKFYKDKKTLDIQLNRGKHSMQEGKGMPIYSLGVTEFLGGYGHNGQTLGFQSFVAANPTTKTNYVLLMNNANANSMMLYVMLVNALAQLEKN
ncbi:serine hydrolase domain-containing protein [Oceanivirga miroungae]|uniref:Beta-lactamase-related domain-containing protein n=1 Tax=Oceanivirga miroungae TaxID=1130046 RepID=A0A6I8M9N5_9FUSO|nr:serine hydrolase domain-containing protein [Oceanivirga miroungae]VWL85005.1 hypothetical protein OMES3154_00277 [Oceanivirga miroungae]